MKRFQVKSTAKMLIRENEVRVRERKGRERQLVAPRRISRRRVERHPVVTRKPKTRQNTQISGTFLLRLLEGIACSRKSKCKRPE